MFETLYKNLTSDSVRAAYLKTVDYVEVEKLLESPNRKGKLNGVSVLKLSVNCGRSAWLRAMVYFGYLPEDTKIVSCYGGNCWQEFTTANNFAKKRLEVETIAEYRAKVVNASAIAKLVKPRTKAFKDTFIYREGQAGDSSHAFIIQESGKSAAIAWLEAVRAAGIKTKTVFITAGYAPVRPEEWEALEKYNELFKLHFSLSGWFSKEEINCRLAMFEAARKAGLDPFVRIVTNKDHIQDVTMPNESYLFECLEALGVNRAHILETPFHYDRKKVRSHAKLENGPICCDTGHCNTCTFACMTK